MQISSVQELKEIIAQGESARLELKIAPPRPTELAERVCGLANASGGYIVIGVVDQTLEVKGIQDTSGALDNLLRAARLCQPTVPFNPPEPQIFVVEGKKVVVATIPANRGDLYQAGGIFWKRRGTHTIPLTLDEIAQALNNQGRLIWETQPVPRATLDDLDPAIIKTYLEKRPVRNKVGERFDQIEQLLLSMDCAVETRDEQGNKKVCPTNAGLLVFGYQPQRYIVQAEVACVLYNDILGVEGYADRRILTGPLSRLIEDAEDFFQRNMRFAGRIEGFHRVEEPEFPFEALREAVVNALIHRDWSSRGETVRIFYYPDRIEIHNPGQLLPGITVEDLETGQAPSKLRNPIVANLLRDLGYVERLGSGVRLMINQMQRRGRPTPEFNDRGEVSVIFRQQSRQAVKNTLVETPNPDNTVTVIQKTVPAVPSIEKPSSPAIAVQMQRLEAAMQHVQQRGAITSGEYRALTGVSENTATRDLEELVKRGALKAVGERRGRYYTLP
ncbi:MAG TPA: helix-turn-helix domain-containing protein [Chloroflexia bacterium]|nr:helix-turn-helix domain-containing protein [Chloroflexia bacterium]